MLRPSGIASAARARLAAQVPRACDGAATKLTAGTRDKELRTIRLWLSKIAENLQD